MKNFKKFTSVKIWQRVDQVDYDVDKTKRGAGGFKIWQGHFDEYYIRDRMHLEEKLDYIHNNPLQVHWYLSKNPEGYLYSTAAYYLHNRTKDAVVSHYLDFY